MEDDYYFGNLLVGMLYVLLGLFILVIGGHLTAIIGQGPFSSADERIVHIDKFGERICESQNLSYHSFELDKNDAYVPIIKCQDKTPVVSIYDGVVIKVSD